MNGRESLQSFPYDFLFLVQQKLIGPGRGLLHTFLALEFLFRHELERNELSNPLLPDLVDAEIDSDPINPGIKRGIKLKSLKGPKHANEDFLAEVIYLFSAPQSEINDVRDLALIAPDDLFKRLVIASAESPNKLKIVGLLFHAELRINGYQVGKFLDSALKELCHPSSTMLEEAEEESIHRDNEADLRERYWDRAGQSAKKA